MTDHFPNDQARTEFEQSRSRITQITLPEKNRWVWPEMPSVTGWKIECLNEYPSGPCYPESAFENRLDDIGGYWRITGSDGQTIKIGTLYQRDVTRELLEQYCAMGCPILHRPHDSVHGGPWVPADPCYWDIRVLIAAIGPESRNPWPFKVEQAAMMAFGALLCAGLWTIAAGVSAILRGGVV